MRSSFGLVTIFSMLFLAILAEGCSNGESPSSPNRFQNNDGINIDDPNFDDTNPNDVKTRWDVPGGPREIARGCLGLDCIPSLQNPIFIEIEAVTYLNDTDLVYGVIRDKAALAYPHRILDWHEIVNHTLGTQIAVTHCPLTGSGVGINVSLTGLEGVGRLESFGVSGLLYNNNLIPYDRQTGSNWSQMYLRAVNGELRGAPIKTIPLIETSWKTWKKMFPDSKVLSVATGFDRPYEIFPYGNYKTSPDLLFPITIDDSRLPRKERVHVVITDRYELKARTYRFSNFERALALNDDIDGQKVVVAGKKSDEFYISYSRTLDDGTTLTFDIDAASAQIYPFNLVDNEGNIWNVLGEGISGNRIGEQLTPTASYNAYWFAVSSFYPEVEIY